MRKDIHTIRGELDWTHASDPGVILPPQQLYLDNMDFTKNWKVLDFKVFPTGPAYVTNDLWDNDTHLVTLATKQTGAFPATSVPDLVRGFTVRDNRQIAWSVWNGSGPGTMQQPVLDPTHLVVSDLWINGFRIDSGTGTLYTLNQPVGFIVTLQLVTTTIDEALMALLRERAQDTLAH